MCHHCSHWGCIRKCGTLSSRRRFCGQASFSGGRLFILGLVSRLGRNGRPSYTSFLPRCRATSSPDFLCSLTVLRIPCTFPCRGTSAFLFLLINSVPLR